jgi:hypothetical protein
MLIWICQNDFKAAQGPLELAITKMWNFGIRFVYFKDTKRKPFCLLFNCNVLIDRNLELSSDFAADLA